MTSIHADRQISDPLAGPGPFDAFQVETFERLTELDEPDVFWLVRSGLVRLVRSDKRHILLDVYGPGSVAVAPAEAGAEHLVAEAGTVVVRIEQDQLHDLVYDRPDLVLSLVHALVHQKRVLRERLGLHRQHRVHEQLKAFLDLLAVEVGVPCRHGHSASLDIVGLSHQDIADLMGSSRPYVSTLMSQLLREGAIAAVGPRQVCLAPALHLL